MSLREEGNKLFRQGRWARAADLYEQAVSQDSSDAKAWSNLAQARLNLQEYPQAFSAATRAHELDPSNAKPLYRLALAQRGMNKPQSALQTLASAPQVPEVQTLAAEIKNDLAIQHDKTDPGSQAGLQSLREGFLRREGADGSTRSGDQQRAERARVWAGEDVRERREESALERKARDAALKKEAREKAQKKEEERESKQKATEGWAREQRERTGSGEAMDVDTPAPATAPSPVQAPTEKTAAPKNSFAALNAARAARRSYAGNSGAGAGMPGLVPVSTTRTSQPQAARKPLVQTAPPTAVPSAVPSAVASAVPSPAPTPAPPRPTPPAHSAQTESSRPAPSFAPPSNPHSTAAGAGLSLLRTLDGLSPADGFKYLRHYTPAVIAKIMDGLLDPDALGLILRALDAGKEKGHDEWIREVINGLKSNRRWKMTELMLPKSDREALARLSS